VLLKVVPVFTVLLFLFSWYAGSGQVYANHTDIFIPVLEMEPKSPIAGQLVTLTTVLTNTANVDMSGVQVSFNLDGVWIIDDVSIDLPAKKSVRVSFVTLMPVNPGGHTLKACPDRESLGDDGHQCRTLDFVAIDESTIVVVILSPKEEEALRGDATIRVAAFGQDAEKVELYVQNKLVDTKYQAPFDFTFDTTKYENGQYRIYAIAYYESGTSKASSIKKYLIDNGGSVVLTLAPEQVHDIEAKVGHTVVIESDITNGQPFKIAATLIVLVKDSEGFTEFLAWKEDSIPIGETIPMSQVWIPEKRGEYTVEGFLWDTIESAVPLSDVMKASVVVN
jgi:hypothetical protein